MAAECVEVAEALRALINSGTFTIGAFTTERIWVAERDVSQLRDLRVDVVTDIAERTIETRGKDTRVFLPTVLVRRRIDPEDNDATDDLAELVEELEEFTTRKNLLVIDAIYAFVRQDPAILNDEFLRENNIFWAAFQPTYRKSDAV